MRQPWWPRPARPVLAGSLVLLTKLRLKRYRDIPRFFGAANRLNPGIQAAPGLLGFCLRTQMPRRTFWTLSAWESRGALDAFYSSRPRGHAMGETRALMEEFGSLPWTKSEAGPPTWGDADGRWKGRTQETG